jgi:MSHA pilin protein MshD
MRRQSAFTLVEVIVTVVVLAVAATALISVYTSMVRGSADPVIQQQAITVAEAYMEEILRKAYKDPRDPIVAETGSAEAGEDRDSFNDVQDYNFLPANQDVRDQNNNPITALAAYTVTVNVQAATLSGIAAMQIDVTVTHPVTGSILLSAFRTQY